MKVLITVDMEGIAGVASVSDVLYDAHNYPAAQIAMTDEANAAVEGAFAGGATDVIVNDSHHTMCNLLIDRLDPRARLIRGERKPLLMVQGVERDRDAVVCIGYHGRAGGSNGVLNHTFLAKELVDVEIGGRLVGEIGVNAYVAGHFGVPIAFVAGDDEACAEARALLGDDLPHVVTKEAIDRTTALCTHPAVVREQIRDGVRAAVAAAGRPPLRLTEPTRFVLRWSSSSTAALAAFVPGVELDGPRATAFVTDDAAEAMRMIQVCNILALHTAAHEAPLS